jgi:hypothetical protein
MNKKIINEGLDYLDLEGQLLPTVSIDEYEAKMGKNSDIITLAFTVKSTAAGQDLCDWFERGYDFVLDCQVSEGEVSPNRYLVFVEMNRRTSAPKRIEELLKDLTTLTGYSLKDWEIAFKEDTYDVDVDILSKVLTLSPHEYRIKEEDQEELNEMLGVAGLNAKKIYNSEDADLKDFISKAGL